MDIIALIITLITIVSFVITILYLQFTSQGRELKHNIKICFQKFLRRYPSVEKFCESYKDIPWQEYIENANEKIDIVVYYFDSWIRYNFESLKKFFGKPNTKVRLFLSNPNRKENMENLKRIFPEYEKNHLRLKVRETREKIAGATKVMGASPKRVELYYYPHYLNYSAICFDDKILILSFFEFNRMREIKSPAIIINLEKSQRIKEFWEKELKNLTNLSDNIEYGMERTDAT